MIKKIAWNTFKKTGDIDAFLEFKQIENIENNIKEIQNITNLNLQNKEKWWFFSPSPKSSKGKKYGKCKNKWNSNCRTQFRWLW